MSLIAAGYDPDFIRDQMTLLEFRTLCMMIMQRELTKKRAESVALSATLASLISEEARQHLSEFNENADQVSEELTNEIRRMYGLPPEKEIEVTHRISSRSNTPASVDKPDGDDKDKAMLRNLIKIDSAMAAFTGKATGAPWSVVNKHNIDDAFSNNGYVDRKINEYMNKVSIETSG